MAISKQDQLYQVFRDVTEQLVHDLYEGIENREVLGDDLDVEKSAKGLHYLQGAIQWAVESDLLFEGVTDEAIRVAGMILASEIDFPELIDAFHHHKELTGDSAREMKEALGVGDEGQSKFIPESVRESRYSDLLSDIQIVDERSGSDGEKEEFTPFDDIDTSPNGEFVEDILDRVGRETEGSQKNQWGDSPVREYQRNSGKFRIIEEPALNKNQIVFETFDGRRVKQPSGSRSVMSEGSGGDGDSGG